MFLAIVQLALFVVLPRRENEKSPLEKLANWFTGRDRNEKEKDLETGDCSEPSSPQKTPSDINSGLHERFEKLMAAEATESRRASIDFMGRPPSYKSRSSSVPDITYIQST